MYSSTIFDLVDNKQCTFYKLSFDGKCQFDEFCAAVRQLPQESKSMRKIIAMMDMFDRFLLPKEKFRQIKNMQRSDVFEFKDKNLRVYVIVQKPSVYIALGGFKKNQIKDIATLKNRVDKFPKII